MNIDENTLDEAVGEDCSATAFNDKDVLMKCRKKNVWFDKYQEYFEHSGGHIYMTDSTYEVSEKKRREGWHFDNEAILSLRPAASHAPQDCDQTGFCSWRKYGV